MTQHPVLVVAMSSLEIYRETIWWKLILLLMALVDVPLVASIWYAFTVVAPEGPVELPTLIVLLVTISLTVVGFSRFTVVLTNSGIAVGFVLYKGDSGRRGPPSGLEKGRRYRVTAKDGPVLVVEEAKA